MQITTNCSYVGYESIKIENNQIALWVTTTVGPRVIGLELTAGENLFAELPDASIECPGVGDYQLRGGHRLWQAPEDPRRTYLPDDDPLSVRETPEGVIFTQPVEPQTGIEKSLVIDLPNQQAEVIVEHQLKVRQFSPNPVSCPMNTAFCPIARSHSGLILKQIRSISPGVIDTSSFTPTWWMGH